MIVREFKTRSETDIENLIFGCSLLAGVLFSLILLVAFGRPAKKTTATNKVKTSNNKDVVVTQQQPSIPTVNVPPPITAAATAAAEGMSPPPSSSTSAPPKASASNQLISPSTPVQTAASTTTTTTPGSSPATSPTTGREPSSPQILHAGVLKKRQFLNKTVNSFELYKEDDKTIAIFYVPASSGSSPTTVKKNSSMYLGKESYIVKTSKLAFTIYQLKSGGKKLQLEAKTEDERAEWVAKIQNAIDSLKNST